MQNNNKLECKRCILTSLEGVYSLDERGFCNLCSSVERLYATTKSNTKSKLPKPNPKAKYDCIIGLSGGIDSSYTLHKACQLGYSPLVVHFDAGWDTKEASQNIVKMVNILAVDYVSEVVSWNEYRDSLIALFDSDVPDLELLYDNLMLSTLYTYARQYKIKYIFAGTNTALEGIRIPRFYSWFKWDKRNLESIIKKNGVTICDLKFISIYHKLFFELLGVVKWISFLDYVDYNKQEALEVLRSDYDYSVISRKHAESFFTDYYERIILPQKHSFDKRRIHLSSLILSGQISRQHALELVSIPPSLDHLTERMDKKYLCHKLGRSSQWLDNYLSRKPVSHAYYPNTWTLYISTIHFLKRLLGWLKFR